MRCYYCLNIIQDNPKHGLHPTCFQKGFGLPEEITNFENISLRQSSDHSVETSLVPAHTATSLFQGKFKKYTAHLGSKEYILKVQEKKYPELPQMEYLSNQLADLFHLDIPPFYLISFENVYPTFVSENFMNYFPKANLVHIYRYMQPAETWSCETVLNIIKTQVGTLSACESFVRLCLFDALIGNHDRHGRNLALIETPKKILLSPFYDNPSYFGIEDDNLLGADLNPKGKLYTKDSQEPELKDYIKEFQRLGYKEQTYQFFDTFDSDSAFDLIDKAFLSDKRKQALRNFIEKQLRNALS